MPPTTTSTLGDADPPTSPEQHVADRADSIQRSGSGSGLAAVPRISKDGVPSQVPMPSFPQWQARHLAGRDLLFGVALVLMYLMYLHKTLPAVCAAINQWHNTNNQQQQGSTTAWHTYICNSYVSGSDADTPTAADENSDGVTAASSGLWLAAGIISRVLSAAMKALLGFFAAACISNDPLYLITPLVRLAALLLLLLPIPYPNLAAAWHALRSPRSSTPSSRSWMSWYHPDHYWQYPCIRNTIVIWQRLLPGAVTAVCKRSALCSTGWYPAFLAQPCMWQLVGKYAYAGWTACMLMLPLRLHLLVNGCEWVIHNMVYTGPDTHSSSSSSSGISDLQHAILSMLTVVIIPTAVIWWREERQRRRYFQLSQQAQYTTAAAAAAAAAAAVGDDDVGASCQPGSSSSSGPAAQASPGSPKQQQQQQQQDEDPSRSREVSRTTSGSSSQMQSIFSTQSGKEVYLTEQDLCGTGSNSSTPRHTRRSFSSPDPRELQPEDDPLISTSISASSSSNCSCSGVPIRSISSPSPLAVDFAAGESREPICQQQLLADVTASLQLAADHSAAAAAAVYEEPQMPSQDLVRAASLAAGLGGQISGSRSSSIVQPDFSGLRPAIRSLLADEAAEVFAAAAANAVAAGGAPGVYTSPYRGVATSLPIVMKVHTSHDSVSRLSPVLSSVLHYQLMSGHTTHSEPLAIHTAAFEGCVQLVANVIGLKSRLPVDSNSITFGGSTAVDAVAGSSSSSSSLAAASLLSAVSCVLQHNTQQDPAAITAAVAAASDQDALGAWSANSKGGSSIDKHNASPHVDVIVGRSVVSSHSSCSSSNAFKGNEVSSDLDLPAISLQSCSPVVLTSDLDRQAIRLSLKLSGQQQQPQQVRALVIRDGGVIIDERVTLSKTVSVSVPRQQPGLIHVVLLNDDSALNGDRSAASISAHSPLLLLPLLVLPAAAAVEWQQHFQQQAAAAAGGYESDNISSIEQSAAWSYSIMPLTVDLAYILGLCDTAKAAAPAARVSLPASAQLVLRHLLVHMASCGMLHSMQWVVDTAAAIFCSNAAAAAVVTPDVDSSDLNSTRSVGTSDLDQADDSSMAAEARSSTVAVSKVSASVVPKRSSSDLLGPSQADTLDSRAATSDRQALATQAADHRSVDLRSCNKLGGIGPNPKPNQRSAAALHPDRITVTPAELLWGFTDRDLEAQYQAVAFRNSARIDMFACLFYLVFSLGAYRARGAAAMLGQQGSGGLLRFNEVLCVVVNVWGPVAVLMLRWKVGRSNLQISSRSQQQQQQQGQNSKTRPCGCCSRSMLTTKQQQQQQQQQQDQIVDHAASSAPDHQLAAPPAQTKQLLLVTYLGTILLWGAALLLYGGSSSSILITPVVLVKAWSKRGWSQDLMAFLSITIRGCTTQVPFSWWLPLANVTILMNVIGSIKYGLMPRYWLFVRYIPLLAVTLGMNALQHIEGRKRFCARHGIPVKP